MSNGEEQPIGFASQTLTTAENNYSQIEKEALLCIFGITKFHMYLYGHKFNLITDHKPLLSLFKEYKAAPTAKKAMKGEKVENRPSS